MKNLTLTLLLIALSFSGFSQSHADHDLVVEKFQRFYNAKLSDSIQTIFNKPTWLWGQKNTDKLYEQYGPIKSMSYIGVDDDHRTHLYKVEAEKETFALGISMNKRKKVGNFRFDTRSAHINKLMGEDDIPQVEHPQEVYDDVMARFQKYYNAKMDERIAGMFSDSWKDVPKDRLWGEGRCEELQKDYGTITSVKFIGEMDDDPSVKLYKVTTTKETYATGLSLDAKKHLMTFRFHTSSPHINKLLKESK